MVNSPRRKKTLEKEEDSIHNAKKKKHPDEGLLSLLPNELIIKVLSNLDLSDVATIIMAPFGHRFRKLCLDPKLWTSLKLPSQERLSHDLTLLLLQSCDRLKELDLRERWKNYVNKGDLESNQYEEVVTFVLRRCHFLSTLHLVDVTPVIHDTIIEHGKRLERLSCMTLKDIDLAKSPDWLSRLKAIHMEDGYIRTKNLRAIADHCRNLEDISFNACALSQNDLHHFLDATKASIRRLWIRKLPEESLLGIDQCQKLETLQVHSGSWSSLTPAELDSISRLSRLTRLSIDGPACGIRTCDLIRAFGDKKMARLKHLEFIYMRGAVNDQVMEVIAENCPSLVDLKLISSGSSEIVQDEELRCQNCSSDMRVTDVGVRNVLFLCSRLWRLHLEGLNGVTDAVLVDIPTPRLERFYVADCKKITPKALMEARERCEFGEL